MHQAARSGDGLVSAYRIPLWLATPPFRTRSEVRNISGFTNVIFG